MNFSSMDYFIAVARERNITRAAERLHITQQTLSAHIAGLERELGCQLLLRKVPLELTYGGEVFLRYAVDIRRRLTDMEQEFGDISGNQKGVLRIGVAITRGHAIMPRLIQAFQRRRPNIMVQLVENSNEKLREDLENGATDLVIAQLPEALPGLEILDFYQEEVVLAVAAPLLDRLDAGARAGLAERLEGGDLSPLRDCPFLLNTRQDIAGQVGRGLLSRAGILGTPQVTSYNIETLLGLCIRGMGACFCPKNLLEMTLSPEQRGELSIFRLSEEARYMIRFGYPKRSHPWAVVTDFIQLARQLVPGESQ